MSQRTFWDPSDEEKDREEGPPPPPIPEPPPALLPVVAAPTAEVVDEDDEPADKEKSRRTAIKRLRAGGHWLTLLQVARTIAQPFTLNDISVAVWRSCPDFFGMKGYPYPDNHKVHYILYGDRGLIAKGLIRRVSQGLFRVPEDVDPDQLACHEEEPEES
jgi:hypothetical protein